MKTMSYTNDLHDALLRKNGTEFWNCWRAKFECNKKSTEVDGCADPYIISGNFVKHFSESYSCNNQAHAESLRCEYIKLRQNYCGFPLTNDLSFDTEIVSTVVLKLKKGRPKAADIDGITAEHLLYCHPSLFVILSKLFRLIVTCVPENDRSGPKLIDLTRT